MNSFDEPKFGKKHEALDRMRENLAALKDNTIFIYNRTTLMLFTIM